MFPFPSRASRARLATGCLLGLFLLPTPAQADQEAGVTTSNGADTARTIVLINPNSNNNMSSNNQGDRHA